MVWFSYHGGHSGEFCGHAKGQLRSVVDAAYAAGFTTYGLSEHSPRYQSEHLYPEEQGLVPADLEAKFRRYVASALELRREYEGRLELLIGFETEALPVADWPEKMRAIRASAPFDYIVGSVHSIGDTWIDLNVETSERAARDNGGWEALRCAYFDRLAELVQTLRPEIVGHVDLIRRFEPPEFRFSEGALGHAERVLEAARSIGAALEVNAAPVRRGFGPAYPGPQVLARACEMGVAVTLGDDSHGPDGVGVGLDACLEAIARAGYRDVHYLTRRDGQVVLASAPLAEVQPERRQATH
ncbi:MAG TPA: histidinol-phosphatase [Polyangiaceae bacterium]|nr:histidinol-phosphatase [Polyangiaceae bacterium]